MRLLLLPAVLCALSAGTNVLADGHGAQSGHGGGAQAQAQARERMMKMERARRAHQEGGNRAEDPLDELLFPPEPIMRHRESLDLSKSQGRKIVSLISGFQSGVVETQWKLLDAKAAVRTQLEAGRIDEKALEAALDALFAMENTVRRRHFLLLAQLRNELSPEQVVLLRSLR